MSYPKFKFKTIKSTEKYRQFELPSADILLNGWECGTIDEKRNGFKRTNMYEVRFMVKSSKSQDDKTPNSTWKWVKIKKDFSTLDEAKLWVRQNNDLIQKKLNIHTL